jgi:hypothetical protein
VQLKVRENYFLGVFFWRGDEDVVFSTILPWQACGNCRLRFGCKTEVTERNMM